MMEKFSRIEVEWAASDLNTYISVRLRNVLKK